MHYSIIFGITIFMIVVILSSLFVALYYLLTSGTNGASMSSVKTVRALTVRISISLLLFGMLFISYYMGYIKPHGIWA